MRFPRALPKALLSAVALAAAFAFSTPAQAANDWAHVVTVSPSTTLQARRVCYTDGLDIACDATAPYIATNGYVGVGGNTNPIAPLDVWGNTQLDTRLFGKGNSSNYFWIGLGPNGVDPTNLAIGIVPSAASATVVDGLIFRTNGTTRISVGSNGYTAIGDQTPQTKLDVSGTLKIASGGESCDASRLGAVKYESGVFSICKNTSNGWEPIATTTSSSMVSINTGASGSLVYRNELGQLYATSTLSISSTTGSVGIGAGPSAAVGKDGLFVSGTTYVGGGILSAGNFTFNTVSNRYISWNGTGGAYILGDSTTKNISFGTSGTEVFRITNGALGIGTTAPSTTLHVSGTLRIANGGEACDANRLGAIKYDTGNFYICRNGTTWETMVAGVGGTVNTDRITSGTASVVTNQSTSSISFTTAGTERANFNSAGRLTLNGGLLLNQGVGAMDNLIYTGPATGSVDASMGFFAAGVGSSGASDGPYFLARGNSFSNIANQRGNMFFAAGNPSSPGAAEGSIQFWTGSDIPRMIIQNNGNIGIGTNVPASSTLHVSGTIQIAATADSCDTSHLGAMKYSANQFYVCRNAGAGWETLTAAGSSNGYTDRIISGTAGVYTNQTGSTVSITTSGIERVLVNSAGNVGINRQPTTGIYLAVSGTSSISGRLGLLTPTSNSVFVGNSAGSAATGVDNAGFGFSTLQNTSGSQGVAMGTYAGQNNTGNYLTAIGTYAGLANIGTNVTAIGATAAQTNSASYVVAVGVNAAQANAAGGTYGAFVGNDSGQFNTGTRVAAVGAGAAQRNTGANLTAMGAYAGQQNSGQDSTAIGYNAGQFNSGARLTAVGQLAANKNTADDVTALGFNAVSSISNTFSNITGLGADAQPTKSNQIMLGNTTIDEVYTYGAGIFGKYVRVGSATTALMTSATITGAGSIMYDTTLNALRYSDGTQWKTLGGSSNLSETLAINDLTDASSSLVKLSVYMGANSGNQSTGSGNTALGINAMASNTTGGLNTATGYGSLSNNTTGSSNTSNGLYTLLNNTSGSFNTAIGRSAGIGQGGGVSVTFSGASLLGSFAGSGLTTGNSNTLIGYNSGAGISTGNNNLVLGADTTPYSNTGNFQLNIANAIWGNIGYGMANTNLIGINVPSPTVALEVSGTISATNILVNGQPLGSNTDRIVSGTITAIAVSNSNAVNVTGPSDISLNVTGGATGTHAIQIGDGRTGNGYAILDLVGDTAYGDYGLRISRDNSGFTDIRHRGIQAMRLTTVEAAPISFATSNTERVVIGANGNVGIGMQPSANTLTVSGTFGVNIQTGLSVGVYGFSSNTTVLNVRSTAANPVSVIGLDNPSQTYQLRNENNIFSIFNANAVTYPFNIVSTGLVGIGTATPSTNLDVKGSTTVDGYVNTTARFYSGVSNSGVVLGSVTGNSAYIGAGSASINGLTFYTSGTSGSAMNLDTSGNLGIGRATSGIHSTKLDVSGTLRIADGGEACDANRAGAIKYNSGTFYTCNGTTWSAFGSGGGGTTFAALTDVSVSVPAGNIYGPGSLVGAINGTNTNTAFGINTMSSTLNTSNGNSAFGESALKVIRAGSVNTAIGNQALMALTNGDNNTAVGGAALAATVTGAYNAAVGRYSLGENTGSYNAAMGAYALRYKTGGSYNAAIGYGSGGGASSGAFSGNTTLGSYAGQGLTTGSSNTLVGYNAGGGLTTGIGNVSIGQGTSPFANTGSWQLNIANAIWGNIGYGMAHTNLIGINVPSPTANLEVSGTISGTNIAANNLSITTINGVSVSALGGGASPTNVPAFRAGPSGGQGIAASTWTKVNINTKQFDTYTNFNTSTNRFTPTVAGYYLITGNVGCTSGSPTACYAGIYKNGANYSYSGTAMTGSQTPQATALLYLNGSTDYVELWAYSQSATTLDLASVVTSFAGTLVASGNGLVSGTGATMLSMLNDVSASTPTNGQVLVYNTTSSKWEASSSVGASSDRIVSGTTSVITYNNTSATIATAGVERLIVGTAGNVGIGVQPTSTYGLSVSGTLGIFGDIMHTGDIYGTSDARLKTDIASMNNAMDTLMGLRPVSFKFRNNPNHLEYGFIAQEVQKIYPNLVHTGTDASKTLSVNYNGFIAPVVQGLQEVNTDVKKLKQENADLRAELEALRAEVRSIAKQQAVANPGGK